MSTILLFALKALIGVGAFAAVGRWLVSYLPAVNVHTASAKLNAIIDTLGNACEAVVKAELSGDLLTQIASAIVNGQPVAGPLAGALPGLKQQVIQQIGPAIQQALVEALGSSDAADKRVTTQVLVAARAHALESAKAITSLADGRKLVAPLANPS